MTWEELIGWRVEPGDQCIHLAEDKSLSHPNLFYNKPLRPTFQSSSISSPLCNMISAVYVLLNVTACAPKKLAFTKFSRLVFYDYTHCLDAVLEYRMHGADNTVLNIQIITSKVRAFLLEFRLCNGLTIAMYLHKNEINYWIHISEKWIEWQILMSH